jgi:hypothetical protein
MPIYTLHNSKTNKTYDEELKYSEYKDLLDLNPHITRVWGLSSKPKFVSGHNVKPDDGFRDVLKHIKKNNKGSDMNTYD